MPIIMPGSHSRTEMTITSLNGKVIINLSEVADQIILSPQDAAQIAAALANCARDIVKGSAITIAGRKDLS